ncbi:protein of unknown function (plasmid) [Paraburkholderia kururiensis]
MDVYRAVGTELPARYRDSRARLQPVTQCREIPRIEQRDAALAEPARADRMQPEIAAAHSIDDGPVVDHVVVAIEGEPGATVGAVDVLEKEIADAAHQAARLAVDDVVAARWQWANILTRDGRRVVTALASAGKRRKRADAGAGQCRIGPVIQDESAGNRHHRRPAVVDEAR